MFTYYEYVQHNAISFRILLRCYWCFLNENVTSTPVNVRDNGCLLRYAVSALQLCDVRCVSLRERESVSSVHDKRTTMRRC